MIGDEEGMQKWLGVQIVGVTGHAPPSGGEELRSSLGRHELAIY